MRAKLVRFAWDYRWSSAAAHAGHRDGTGPINNKRWHHISAGMEWKRILHEAQQQNEINHIRAGTYNGRPLGSDSFMSKIEHYFGRRVRPLPLGRPKRKKLAWENSEKQKQH